MKNTLITVIIPVFNVDEYLEQCLDSVINQTYKNIEIIAINDGSTDNSLKILERYASKNDNITVISQKNYGQSIARNKGIEIANGKHIYFLDSDDYILPETFEHLIKAMEENDLDLIRFPAEPFVDKIDMKVNKKQYDFDSFFDPSRVYNRNECLNLNYLTFTPSPVLYIVKKDLLTNNNIKFKPGIIHEDELFTVEIFLNTSKMMYKPTYYYKRRFRPNSTMTSNTIEVIKKSFDSKCIILSELNYLLDKYKQKHEVKLIKNRIRVITATLIYNYPDIDKNYKKRKIKKIKNTLFLYYYYNIKEKIMRFFSK